MLITGANSGIGYAAAEELARKGAEVHILCRSPQRGREALEKLKKDTGNDNIHLHIADLSVMKETREFAREFSKRKRLDVLVLNAGYMPTAREETPEGIEKSFATNVLSGFALTAGLEDLLRRSAPSRVINVTSAGMYTQRLDVSDLQSSQPPFDGVRVYAQQKRAQMVLTERWAERLAGSGVDVNAMHPGWVQTPGLRPLFEQAPSYRAQERNFRTPAQGADTIVWLAAGAAPAGRSGRLFFDRKERWRHMPLAFTESSRADADALWGECARLAGISLPPFPAPAPPP
eukprot:tig00001095_g7043.t1